MSTHEYRRLDEEKGRTLPTRRAARLAAQKILNTVQMYGLDETEEELRPKNEYHPEADYAPQYTVKRYTTPLSHYTGLFMECYEEILSSAQRYAFFKAKQVYDETTQRLLYLRSINARIINSLDSDLDLDSTETTIETTDSQSGQKLADTNHHLSNVKPPPKQTIVITTGDEKTETPPPQSSSYKVIYDSRTGAVVGTLPGDTTILSQGGEKAPAGLQSRTVLPNDKHKQFPTLSSTIQNNETVENISENKGFQRALTVVTGGHKMVTTFTLLTVRVKPFNESSQEIRLEQIAELNRTLEQEKFREDTLPWMIKIKMLPVQPQCKYCSLQTLKLAPNSSLSDGYMWRCCHSRCRKTSPVSRLPFFERFGISMSKLLALTYHWAMQTEVSAVVKDVGVDVYIVRSMWRALQEVCGISVSTKAPKLGGTHCSVEFGIVQFGRFLILGIYDRRTKLTRMKAISVSIGLNVPTFMKIIEPWLTRKSLVISNDARMSLVTTLGFQHVLVKPFGQEHAIHTNHINDYLKENLSTLFGEFAVNQLKLETIQGYLDELQWRERFGISPSDCFWNILKHVTDKNISQASLFEPEKLSVDAEDDSSKEIVEVYSSLVPESTKEGTPSAAQECSIQQSSGSVTAECKQQTSGKRLAQDTPSVVITKIQKVSSQSASSTNDSDKTESNSANEVSDVSIDEESHSVIEGSCSGTDEDVHVRLDEFYYARLEPKTMLNETIKDKAYTFKCHICKKMIDNNIKVMKHINAHIDDSRQRNLDLSDLTQCKYCFREFDTPYSMQCHIETIHLQTNSLSCRICNQAFPKISQLIYHMKCTHCEKEMPYSCSVCQYRSSFHSDVIEHFQQCHNGSDKVMCHYCLWVYTVKFSRLNIGHVQTFHYHLYKHQCKSSVRKCSTCCLTFLNVQDLKIHKSMDHQSMAAVKGVKPITYTRPIIMLQPNKKLPYKYKPVNSDSKKDTQETKSFANITKLNKSWFSEDLSSEEIQSPFIISRDIINLKCIECQDIIDDSHFKKFVRCEECLYATSCNKSFINHNVKYHSDVKKKLNTSNKKKAPELKSPMFCICGFSHVNGNVLALHLAHCLKYSCYPSRAAATSATIKMEPEMEYLDCQSAFFPPLVVLDENEEESINESFAKLSACNTVEEEDILPTDDPIPMLTDKEKPIVEEKYERPNMLNALGLVRKTTTGMSIEENSEDMTTQSSNNAILSEDTAKKLEGNKDLLNVSLIHEDSSGSNSFNTSINMQNESFTDSPCSNDTIGAEENGKLYSKIQLKEECDS